MSHFRKIGFEDLPKENYEHFGQHGGCITHTTRLYERNKLADPKYSFHIYHNHHYLQNYYICANFNIYLMSLQSMLGRVYSKKALFITVAIILSTVLFISACVHLHKVNELSLKTNYHNPVLVILVTL